MSDNDFKINNQEINSEPNKKEATAPINDPKQIAQSPSQSSSPKWINNRGEEVKQVFGFNENAELVNARVAMIGFIMLIISEMIYNGVPVTKSIFGIG